MREHVQTEEPTTSGGFDIYVNREEDVMIDSVSTLGISDKQPTSETLDEENTENIPFYPDKKTALSSRKHMMTDEPRSPLGDLEASEYYAADCDVSSYFAIPEDDLNTRYNIYTSDSFLSAFTLLCSSISSINEKGAWRHGIWETF